MSKQRKFSDKFKREAAYTVETNQIYTRAVEAIRYEGRLSDYQAGELKVRYSSARKLFELGAFLTAVVWLVLLIITTVTKAPWFVTGIGTLMLISLFAYFMRQTVLLGYKIDSVSERSSMDEFMEEFLSPFPDLHSLFHAWRAQGPLWRHDEVRLTEIAQCARFLGNELHDPGA